MAAAVAAAVVLVPAQAAVAEPSPSTASTTKWTPKPVPAGEVVNGASSPSGQLAQSSEALLKSTSLKPANVIVKLDYDSLAAYRGGVGGLAATSPAETGKALDTRSADAKKYEKHIEGVENTFLAELAKRVPEAKAGQRLRVVYGGVSVRLPANRSAELLKLPGVAAVQEDKRQALLTDKSAAFVGAPAIYSKLGGSASSGKGVVVGVLDSGGWPEHPSFADPGNLPAAPPTKDGTPRVCDFGENPLTPANDPFTCNNKLIGGQAFLDTYHELEPAELYGSARDSDGHGTHTATTSAGGKVQNANPLGIDRGAIHGIAPASHVSVYKVCGMNGCYQSDTTQAIGRAILDGVRVINFSVSGGSEPYSDPVELAFLDAYAAGVFVSASAGNAGPGAGTTDHRGPWVTTVAASTQTRTFQSTVTLTGPGGATATLKGASVTGGVASPQRVVLASAPPYANADCTSPAPPGIFSGKIVVCLGASGRVMKGFSVRQGGAAGMILANPTPRDVFTDSHWLPTVHVDKPETDALLAFLQANPGATASFAQGAESTWAGDAITHFSSRGPGGDFLKPDVTAPGLHILAGHTPTPDTPAGGPAGNLFQVIAGTSMSAPHVAGAAALLFALHPDWTPGQVKSALETTATTKVTKSDRVTPADPFDTGGGRIDLTKAGDPGLTLDETAENFAASAADPRARINLNLPSVNAPTMPGLITANRTVKNVTSRTLTYRASGTTVNGADITVIPPAFTLRPGKSITLKVVITAPGLADGQYFGRVNLKQVGGSRDVGLPVAFFRKEGAVPVEQTCTPETIARNAESTCTVSVRNDTFTATEVTAVSTANSKLRITSATGATRVGSQVVTARKNLAGRTPDTPNVAPGSGPAGYIPLDAFGFTPVPLGDEQAVNLGVPAFVYSGQTYTRIGVVSNGYSVPGGADPDQISPAPQAVPDPALPNNVLASYWTDLDGTDAPGVLYGILTDGVSDWLVLEWRLKVAGGGALKVFQQWIGLNGSEDISYAYDPGNLPGDPGGGLGLTVGAENSTGTGGTRISGPPTTDLRVTSTPGAPGETLTYSFKAKGVARGEGTVTTGTSTREVDGLTLEVDKIIVQ
ncbi:S8 family serine peptidase [Sinosporangium siamense]|uniref:Peptidase S8 n=1 Tax=Sinosporangium siamense TaxID=1367973 RepID=A0A919REH7_9ACTN|nr:S8 family serine peptidase [Sinosporangium siamense]GII92421.1 peptidase S8 [Sinosporangium siamense]